MIVRKISCVLVEEFETALLFKVFNDYINNKASADVDEVTALKLKLLRHSCLKEAEVSLPEDWKEVIK